MLSCFPTSLFPSIYGNILTAFDIYVKFKMQKPTNCEVHKKMHKYKAFGLKISSELELPELLTSTHIESDLTIKIGKIPTELPDTLTKTKYFSVAKGKLLFHLNGIASYYVEDGTKITIAPSKESKESDIRLFLLGSAMGCDSFPAWHSTFPW